MGQTGMECGTSVSLMQVPLLRPHPNDLGGLEMINSSLSQSLQAHRFICGGSHVSDWSKQACTLHTWSSSCELLWGLHV